MPDFFEAAGDLSPGRGSFDARSGKWSRVYYVGVQNAGDLTDAIQRIIGRTHWLPAGGTSGKLVRSLPLADPQFPWLYADAVSDIVGMGMTDPNNLSGQAGATYHAAVTEFPRQDELPTNQFGLWPVYALTVQFAPRPFRVLPDSAITMVEGTWFNWSGNPQPFSYATEYLRFLDEARTGAAEAISGQQGTMVFSSTGTSNGRVFGARPRMHLPNEALSLTWFNVPYRYLTSGNSYITGDLGRRPWFGCVNQNPLTLLGVTYPPGSLLYLNWKPVQSRYGRAIDALLTQDGVEGYGVEKFIDIQLDFAVTWRTVPAGDLAALPNVPAAANYVRAGWNLQPWLVDRRFHYAQANGTPFMPSHHSAPLELLFTDPGWPQIVTNEG
jgi:hypothetical protein